VVVENVPLLAAIPQRLPVMVRGRTGIANGLVENGNHRVRAGGRRIDVQRTGELLQRDFVLAPGVVALPQFDQDVGVLAAGFPVGLAGAAAVAVAAAAVRHGGDGGAAHLRLVHARRAGAPGDREGERASDQSYDETV